MAAAALAAGTLWIVPSDSFLFLPDRAKPLAPRVHVEGERGSGADGIYFVDVIVRRASLLERHVPAARPEGATVVPEHAVLPPGTTEEERRGQSRRQMEMSERIAAAVALRELGYDVEATETGALIEAVVSGSPAAGKLEPTDVVVAVDGARVRTPEDLRRLVRAREPGERLTLGVLRGAERLELELRTARDPEGHAYIGVAVGQAADVQLPIDVDIDLGAVGGPSAGLAFALDILEELGENVDRGYRVAATGELELDGGVESVGGLEQKTIGARRAGVEVFLVPAGDNARVARRFAGTLRVIAVENFQQALRKLATLPRKS